MSDIGAPQQNDQQRNAIAMALMNIARPPGKGQMPQMPQMPGRLPTNLSGGMSAVGNAIGGMGQPQQPPPPPMSLAPPGGAPPPPPPMGAQQPPPVPPPQPGAPPPMGAPVGAGGPQMPQDPMLQGTGSLY